MSAIGGVVNGFRDSLPEGDGLKKVLAGDFSGVGQLFAGLFGGGNAAAQQAAEEEAKKLAAERQGSWLGGDVFGIPTPVALGLGVLVVGGGLYLALR